MITRSRRGLTIIEVVVALLLLAAGALGLAGSSAALLRQMASDQLRARASWTAVSKVERLDASKCPTGAGVDRSAGLVNEWSITPFESYSAVNQTITRFNSRGLPADFVRAAVPCD